MVFLLRPDEVPKDLICVICMTVPTDPCYTKCDHLFCRDCLCESLRHQATCPVCRNDCRLRDVARLKEGTLLYRIWSGIQIHCDHRQDWGCNWTGSIADYQAHTRDGCDGGRKRRKLQSDREQEELIDALTTEKETLSFENQYLSDENQRLNAANHDLSLENQFLADETQRLSCLNTSLSTENQVLWDKWKKKKTAETQDELACENQYLLDENERLSTSNECLATENSVLIKHKDNLQLENQSLSRRLDQAEAKYDTLVKVETQRLSAGFIIAAEDSPALSNHRQLHPILIQYHHSRLLQQQKHQPKIQLQ